MKCLSTHPLGKIPCIFLKKTLYLLLLLKSWQRLGHTSSINIKKKKKKRCGQTFSCNSLKISTFDKTECQNKSNNNAIHINLNGSVV